MLHHGTEDSRIRRPSNSDANAAMFVNVLRQCKLTAAHTFSLWMALVMPLRRTGW